MIAQRHTRSVWGLFLLLGAFGCDDGPDEPGQMGRDFRIREDRSITDVGPTDRGPDKDQGPTGDMRPDQELDAAIRTINDCDDACAVYGNCGRLDLWNGSLDECQTACTDAEESPEYTGYITCLQITDCDALDECPVPEKPLPTCEAVCEAMDACDADFRLPAGFPDYADCAAACADPNYSIHVSQCGQDLPDSAPDTCDVDGVHACLIDQIDGDCPQICRQLSACDETVDLVDCTLECLGQEAPARGLPERRFNQRRGCVLNSMDCATIESCLELEDGPTVDPEAVARVCEADAECGFFSDEDCPAAVTEVLKGLDDDAADCLARNLNESCESSIHHCFQPRPYLENQCAEYCLASRLCDRLDGMSEGACFETCTAAINGDVPTEKKRWQRKFRCAYEDSCEEMAACRDHESPRGCNDVCNPWVICQIPSVRLCDVDCADRFDSDRVTEQALCTYAATADQTDDCRAIQRCIAPPVPNCRTLCELEAECGLAVEDCEVQCDNDTYQEPTIFPPIAACVASSHLCSDRAACLADPPVLRGGECIAWCTMQEECNLRNPFNSYEECLFDCSLGELSHTDGIVFESNWQCYERAGRDAGCEALNACEDEIEFWDFCPGYCGELERCGVIPEGCLEECQAQPNDPPLFDAASCALATIRRRAGCAEVAACIDADVEPASDACSTQCAAQAACDEEIDLFLCERDCMANPEGSELRAVCAAAGVDCEEELPLCLAAGPDAPAACAEACSTLEACDGVIGEGDAAVFADLTACLAECGGRAVLGEPDFPETALECVTAIECNAEQVLGCFGDGLVDCDSIWAALEACPGAADLIGQPNEAAFLMQCELDFQMDAAGSALKGQCIIDTSMMAMGDAFACLGIVGCLL